MKRKTVQKASLYRLVQQVSDRIAGHTDDAKTLAKLRQAVLTQRLWQIYGPKHVLGSWMALEEFLDEVPPEWADRRVSLCIFVGIRQQNLFHPAVVVDFLSAPNKEENNPLAEILATAGVSYVPIPAAAVAENYLKSSQFSSQIAAALISAAAFVQEESFTSAPRPIYPPRPRKLRD